ncbi:MAG: hypothetical protein LBC45_02620 [Chlamydiales bacterium]|nr:hypothetical protein [Chlamydiales bacterium]
MATKSSFSFPSFHTIKSGYLQANYSVHSKGKEMVKNLYVFFRPLSPDAIKAHAEKRKELSLVAIDQLFQFGKTLESYHPGKMKKIFTEFQKKYERHEDRENVTSLEENLEEASNKFAEIYEKALRRIECTDQRKNEIKAAFERFSEEFKTLLASPYDQEKLKGISILLDAFHETIMQSHQLYIGLDKVLDYIGHSNSSTLQTLKEQFNPDLTDRGFHQITKKEAKRNALLDLIADACAILKTLTPKTTLKTIGKNDDVKNVLLKTILEKSAEVTSFMQIHMEKHRTSVFRKIKTYLNDNTSSYKDLQKKLELLPNDKKAQDLLSDLGKMRFYFKDDAPRSCCNTLKEKLDLLLKEQPYLFTEREKIALIHLLENLSVISYGKRFHQEDVQKCLNQCQGIVKELLPKETLFSQITIALSKLGISLIRGTITPNEHEHVTDLLHAFLENPKVFFKEEEKREFLDLQQALLFDPNQLIPKERMLSLQLQKCLKLIKEIEKRPPSIEGSKLAIERELERLAKHATNLTFMMYIDKMFFNSTRDSLFYRNIIQKSEEVDCCPKQLFLDKLKTQEFPTWKIVLAKICFFVAKHLKIEHFIHTTISRTISNYSTMIYQKLDQECAHDQFQVLIQKLVENATIYFHLLGSAISNAKIDAQKFPEQEQVSRLIIEQLLSLKLGDNEATLKELNLHDLYSKLVDDLVEKSESNLLKWVVPHLHLDKSALVSSIIETGIYSFIKPDLSGNAPVLDLFIRDSLRTFYKKLQQLEEDSQEELSPSPLSAEKFTEKLMQTLSQHRHIQQLASTTKILIALKNRLHELRKHAPKERILDPQIEMMEQTIHNIELLLNFQNTQILQGKDREALFILPILRDRIMSPLKALGNFFLPISSKTVLRKHTISVKEPILDNINVAIRTQVDSIIKEKALLTLTKLLNAPPSGETLYDWIYQGLALANQAIEHPKENKEKQGAVKEEITELLGDISAFIASTVLRTKIKNFTKIERLSSVLAEINPIDLPSWISPIIQERLQNIVDLATHEALYQPELVIQLGRRVVLPTTAFLKASKENLPTL